MIKQITLAITILATAALSAQPLALSLKEAQELAIDSSYAMRNAVYDIENAKREVKEVLAIGLPQVNAAAEYNQFLQIPVQLIPAEFLGGQAGEFREVQFGVEYNLTGSITASQLVFDGTYLVGLKASKTYLELSRNAKNKTEAEIRVAVAQAYYTVLIADENLRILQENIKSVVKTLSDTEALFDNGLTEEQDVDQLTLNRNQIQINIDNTEKYQTVARQMLNYVLGISLERETILTDRIDDLVALNNNPEYLLAAPNLATHPDLMLARTNLMVQNHMLKGDQAAYYPSLNLFLTHRQNAQRDRFNFTETGEPWFPSTILGVNLTIPIFSSFQKNYRVQRARIEIDRAEMNLSQTQENLALGVTRARSEYENALKTWNNQKESMALAKRINERTRIKYTEGISSSFELNVSETQLLNEQSRYIDAALKLLTAKQELDKAYNIF